MTDFFADLEQELRAAHPRRSRLVVPVAPVLMAVAAIVAIASAVSLLHSAEREVAQQPPAAVAPLEGKRCTSDLEVLEQRLPVFSRSVSQDRPPRDVALLGQIEVFLEETRVVEVPGGGRYFVYPACGTTVCLLREGTQDTACGGAVPDVPDGQPVPDDDTVVVTHEFVRGADVQIAGLATRGVRAVRLHGEQDALAPAVDVVDGVFHATVPRVSDGPGPASGRVWIEVLTGS